MDDSPFEFDIVLVRVSSGLLDEYVWFGHDCCVEAVDLDELSINIKERDNTEGRERKINCERFILI